MNRYEIALGKKGQNKLEDINEAIMKEAVPEGKWVVDPRVAYGANPSVGSTTGGVAYVTPTSV